MDFNECRKAASERVSELRGDVEGATGDETDDGDFARRVRRGKGKPKADTLGGVLREVPGEWRRDAAAAAAAAALVAAAAAAAATTAAAVRASVIGPGDVTGED